MVHSLRFRVTTQRIWYTNKSKQRKCWVLVCCWQRVRTGFQQVSCTRIWIQYWNPGSLAIRYNQTGRSNGCVYFPGGTICQQALKHQSHGRFGHRCDGVTAYKSYMILRIWHVRNDILLWSFMCITWDLYKKFKKSMQDAIAMVIQTTYQTFNLGIDLVLLKDSRAVEYLGRRYYLVLYHSKTHISYRSFVCKSFASNFYLWSLFSQPGITCWGWREKTGSHFMYFWNSVCAKCMFCLLPLWSCLKSCLWAKSVV